MRASELGIEQHPPSLGRCGGSLVEREAAKAIGEVGGRCATEQPEHIEGIFVGEAVGAEPVVDLVSLRDQQCTSPGNTNLDAASILWLERGEPIDIPIA